MPYINGQYFPEVVPEAPTEDNSQSGTGIPANENNASVASVEPSGGIVEDKVIAHVNNPLIGDIKQSDIDNAYNIAMAAGPGTIAGSLSKTADLTGKTLAKLMESKGLPAEQIRKDTGWMKDNSGNWSYEISDDAMKLVDRDWHFGETGKLGDFVDHPKLFEAYPELKDINFKVADKGEEFLGGYSEGSKNLMVNPSKIKGGDEGLLDVISHELQHAVQSIEGFPKGSNPDRAFDTAALAIRNKLREANANGNTGLMSELLTLYNDIHSNFQRFKDYMYQRVPGEVQANNTMARRKMTEEQRQQFSPQEFQKMIEGLPNPVSGGTFLPEFNYPK